jgi:very-short-patch-repair endonuclease
MATARDRDRVRQIVLENLGWTILRTWSTDFFIDPEAALDRLQCRDRRDSRDRAYCPGLWEGCGRD